MTLHSDHFAREYGSLPRKIIVTMVFLPSTVIRTRTSPQYEAVSIVPMKNVIRRVSCSLWSGLCWIFSNIGKSGQLASTETDQLCLGSHEARVNHHYGITQACSRLSITKQLSPTSTAAGHNIIVKLGYFARVIDDWCLRQKQRASCSSCSETFPVEPTV